MTLDAIEFIHRFLMHILPKGFVRIKHYGIYSSSTKEKSAMVIIAQVPASGRAAAAINKSDPQPYNPKQCPICKKGNHANHHAL